MKHKRQRWRRRLAQIDPRRLVCLDESGAKTNMTRLRGRAPRGQRLHAHAPHGHWKTTTMISAIRPGGVGASMVFDGPTDAAAFGTYVQWLLVPSLSPGDIVVMDNLSSHRVNGVVESIQAAGAEAWYLPPYSPDLNPIEAMWSKVKQQLRGAAARTATHLHQAIGDALQAVTAQDTDAYFNACGYRTNK